MTESNATAPASSRGCRPTRRSVSCPPMLPPTAYTRCGSTRAMDGLTEDRRHPCEVVDLTPPAPGMQRKASSHSARADRPMNARAWAGRARAARSSAHGRRGRAVRSRAARAAGDCRGRARRGRRRRPTDARRCGRGNGVPSAGRSSRSMVYRSPSRASSPCRAEQAPTSASVGGGGRAGAGETPATRVGADGSRPSSSAASFATSARRMSEPPA